MSNVRKYRARSTFPVFAVGVLIATVAAIAPASGMQKTKPKPKPTTKRATTAPLTTRPATSTSSPSTTKAITGTVNVFAATSLTSAFRAIGDQFESAHPGVIVNYSFAGSSTLVTQIQNGAPADVFASADTPNMDKIVKAKLTTSAPVIFTHNTLMIVVPRRNPLRVEKLADLARPEVFVALGAPGVPVGDYAREILARAGVSVTPKTLESNVASIVNKAALREIDAGIVYVTDVANDDNRVDGVAIPADQNVVANYPIATLNGGANAAAAQEFVAFMQTSTAQNLLANYKFMPLK